MIKKGLIIVGNKSSMAGEVDESAYYTHEVDKADLFFSRLVDMNYALHEMAYMGPSEAIHKKRIEADTEEATKTNVEKELERLYGDYPEDELTIYISDHSPASGTNVGKLILHATDGLTSDVIDIGPYLANMHYKKITLIISGHGSGNLGFEIKRPDRTIYTSMGRNFIILAGNNDKFNISRGLVSTEDFNVGFLNEIPLCGDQVPQKM